MPFHKTNNYIAEIVKLQILPETSAAKRKDENLPEADKRKRIRERLGKHPSTATTTQV